MYVLASESLMYLTASLLAAKTERTVLWVDDHPENNKDVRGKEASIWSVAHTIGSRTLQRPKKTTTCQ